MKAEAIKDYYILNGDLISTNDLTIFEKIIKPSIYEIIRVIDGVPLFLEDHLRRMFDSAHIINQDIEISDKEIRESIRIAILKNNINKSNIKLLYTDVDGIGKVFMVYCVESFYPPEEYYKNGIRTILFEYERENPNAKVLVSSFKDDVAKTMKDKNAFEALLVRKDGIIPEGSRSNIFFVKGEKLYTAPKEEVLLGITRKHLFQIADNLNVKIVEQSIHIDDIHKLDGAFMTGTSVNILPISKIDDLNLGSVNNKVITELNKGYNELISEYIEKNKTTWK